MWLRASSTQEKLVPWQRFQMKGEGEGVSGAKTDAKQELNRLAISRGSSAEERRTITWVSGCTG